MFIEGRGVTKLGSDVRSGKSSGVTSGPIVIGTHDSPKVTGDITLSSVTVKLWKYSVKCWEGSHRGEISH